MRTSHPLSVSFGGEVREENASQLGLHDIMTRPKYMGRLGFWDLEIFNLALLARQAWRIMSDPESLSAKTMKVVYFPDFSLLEAKLGNHPSQILCDVLDGRDVLAQRII